MIDTLVKQLEDLRGDSLEYWAMEFDPDDSTKTARSKLLAQKMKSAIHCISADLNYYKGRYKNKKRKDWSAMLMDIADDCTGGAFESGNRKTEDGRCLSMANSISKLRSELLREKI